MLFHALDSRRAGAGEQADDSANGRRREHPREMLLELFHVLDSHRAGASERTDHPERFTQLQRAMLFRALDSHPAGAGEQTEDPKCFAQRQCAMLFRALDSHRGGAGEQTDDSERFAQLQRAVGKTARGSDASSRKSTLASLRIPPARAFEPPIRRPAPGSNAIERTDARFAIYVDTILDATHLIRNGSLERHSARAGIGWLIAR